MRMLLSNARRITLMASEVDRISKRGLLVWRRFETEGKRKKMLQKSHLCFRHLMTNSFLIIREHNFIQHLFHFSACFFRKYHCLNKARMCLLSLLAASDHANTEKEFLCFKAGKVSVFLLPSSCVSLKSDDESRKEVKAKLFHHIIIRNINVFHRKEKWCEITIFIDGACFDWKQNLFTSFLSWGRKLFRWWDEKLFFFAKAKHSNLCCFSHFGGMCTNVLHSKTISGFWFASQMIWKWSPPM